VPRVAAILLVVLAFLGTSPAAFCEDAPVEAFLGTYQGRAISDQGEGLSVRDLGVSIKPADRGFLLKWTTITRRADGRLKRKSYAISFVSTRRTGIYASAMRRDKFGNRLPLDPLKGDPYVWARIIGNTLTVYALLIIEDGGYEIQVYDRTLSPEGLELRFSRFRDGEALRTITGSLVRMDG